MSRTRMHVWTSLRGLARAASLHRSERAYAPWHRLYFLPEPHQHGSLRPICSAASTRRCWTGGASSTAPTGEPSGPTAPSPADRASAGALREVAGLRVRAPPRVGHLAGARRAAARRDRRAGLVLLRRAAVL